MATLGENLFESLKEKWERGLVSNKTTLNINLNLQWKCSKLNIVLI